MPFKGEPHDLSDVAGFSIENLREFKKEALAWANEQRACKGWLPLNKLPVGIKRSAGSCPLAFATGLIIDRQSLRILDVKMPLEVEAFGRAFDAGLYPELVR